jgi:hypothetical protein
MDIPILQGNMTVASETKGIEIYAFDLTKLDLEVFPNFTTFGIFNDCSRFEYWDENMVHSGIGSNRFNGVLVHTPQ